MNYRRVVLSMAFAMSLSSLVGCGSNQQPIVVTGSSAQTPIVQQVAEQPAPPPTNVPLDLRAVGELFRKAPNVQEFERMLNDPNVGINNLDQNGDGQVDYLAVQSLQPNGAGRSFQIMNVSMNPAVQVAHIQVPPANGQYYEPVLTGNAALYGPNYFYAPRYSLGDVLLLNYLYSSSYSPWMSPYHYGSYAPYYRPYRAVPITEYRTRVVTRTVTRQVPATNNTASQSRVNNSPAATTPARQLTGSGQTQKDFQVRDTTQPVKTGGFVPNGNAAATSSPQVARPGQAYTPQQRTASPPPVSTPSRASSPAPTRSYSPPVSRPSSTSTPVRRR